MKNLILEQKISNLIERKINKRNLTATSKPRNDGLIMYMDDEITILEEIETYISQLEIEYTKRLTIAKKEMFQKGVSSGILECKTGRKHPAWIID